LAVGPTSRRVSSRAAAGMDGLRRDPDLLGEGDPAGRAGHSGAIFAPWGRMVQGRQSCRTGKPRLARRRALAILAAEVRSTGLHPPHLRSIHHGKVRTRISNWSTCPHGRLEVRNVERVALDDVGDRLVFRDRGAGGPHRKLVVVHLGGRPCLIPTFRTRRAPTSARTGCVGIEQRRSGTSGLGSENRESRGATVCCWTANEMHHEIGKLAATALDRPGTPPSRF